MPTPNPTPLHCNFMVHHKKRESPVSERDWESGPSGGIVSLSSCDVVTGTRGGGGEVTGGWGGGGRTTTPVSRPRLFPAVKSHMTVNHAAPIHFYSLVSLYHRVN